MHASHATHADLERPIWNALTSEHAPLARGTGHARVFPRDVSPLAGVDSPAPAALTDLAALADPGETLALFMLEPFDPPPVWRTTRSLYIDQMVCSEPPASGAGDAAASLVRPMTERDVPDMLELTALTQPGPFRQRTIAMGRYFGIRAPDGRLAAMAGERLKLPRYTEVSAVCTHPDHLGRGYAQALMLQVMSLIRAEGKTPFLHVKTDNDRAKRVYERLGFRPSRQIWLAVLERA